MQGVKQEKNITLTKIQNDDDDKHVTLIGSGQRNLHKLLLSSFAVNYISTV